MQEFPQKPVNQQYLWVQNVFHISRFSSCEKSSVSTCFHSGRKPSPWNILWGSRCKSWCGHSAARHCPTPGQCPTQHTANWARCHPLQGMEQECDCQQDQQKWPSTLQCLAVSLAWGLNRLATWEHYFIFYQATCNEHHDLTLNFLQSSSRKKEQMQKSRS